MTRLILGRGAHGELVSRVQRRLAVDGLLADAVAAAKPPDKSAAKSL